MQICACEWLDFAYRYRLVSTWGREMYARAASSAYPQNFPVLLREN